jgi:hypothetical protein
LNYTVITIDNERKVTRRSFMGSHDSNIAWECAREKFSVDEYTLLAIIPGSHEVITDVGRIGRYGKDI